MGNHIVSIHHPLPLLASSSWYYCTLVLRIIIVIPNLW
jgi:hypothetical protein